MAQLLVRDLEDDIKIKLQSRAHRHGRSTVEEVRKILPNAVRDPGESKVGLGTRLATCFASIGLDEDIPELRGQAPQPADFES